MVSSSLPEMPLKGSAMGARGLAATNLAALLLPSGFWLEEGGMVVVYYDSGVVNVMVFMIIFSSSHW